jgi:hypothetical protein
MFLVGKQMLQARGELDEALRIRREEELPVYERLGDVREQAICRTNIGINYLVRGSALNMALHDAQRLKLPEARLIAEIIQSVENLQKPG